MENLDFIFGADGALAKQIQNFEPRENQLRMAEAVAENLGIIDDCDSGEARGNMLVIEAETGIGKTLAYLVPAVLSGLKVVVSTATLTLQDQIINKDLPLIENLLGEKGFLSLPERKTELPVPLQVVPVPERSAAFTL